MCILNCSLPVNELLSFLLLIELIYPIYSNSRIGSCSVGTRLNILPNIVLHNTKNRKEFMTLLQIIIVAYQWHDHGHDWWKDTLPIKFVDVFLILDQNFNFAFWLHFPTPPPWYTLIAPHTFQQWIYIYYQPSTSLYTILFVFYLFIFNEMLQLFPC